MRVALYARVSTKDKGQEVENQLLQLRKFADANGWEIIGEYVDQRSGRKSDNRVAFQAMFVAAYQKQFELVLFWSLDRFSREGVLETLQHLQRLKSYGVNWRSYTEQHIDSAGIFGDVIISLLATLAKQESIRRSERTYAAIERLRAQGKQIGRKRLVVDKLRIRELAAGGTSLRGIAQRLQISHTTVARILAHPA